MVNRIYDEQNNYQNEIRTVDLSGIRWFSHDEMSGFSVSIVSSRMHEKKHYQEFNRKL
jgi:hypothetical protein